MGARMKGEGVEKVYDAAQLWVDCALRTDGSLFTPEEGIWTLKGLGELRERILDKPNPVVGAKCYEWLPLQLKGSPPQVYQLTKELVFMHLLIQSFDYDTKLGWIKAVPSVPIPKDSEDLDAGLQGKFVNTSAGLGHTLYQLGTFIEAVERWKGLEVTEREERLRDPWAFKDFLFNLKFKSKLLADNQNRGELEKHLLLHIVHPDSFEPMLGNDKESLAKAKAFSRFVTKQTTDSDRAIKQIREGLEKELEKDFHFYVENIRPYWKGIPWDVFVALAKKHVDTGRLESEENTYKFEIADKLKAARDAVLGGSDDWRELLKVALESAKGNPIDWRVHDDFSAWCVDNSGLDISSLQMIWAEDESPVTERIRMFNDVLPRSVISGSGSRVNVMSVLLMGLDPSEISAVQIPYVR